MHPYHTAAMCRSELLESIDAYKACDQAIELEGSINPERLARLAEIPHTRPAAFKVKLAFERDDEDHRLINGSLEGRLALQCQRCLNDFVMPMHSDFTLCIVYNDEMAKALPKHLEPLVLMPDTKLNLAQMVEDEILLCLPAYPKHQADECQIQMEFKADNDDLPTETKQHPFQVLKKLF